MRNPGVEENVRDDLVAHASKRRFTQRAITDTDCGVVPLGVLGGVTNPLLRIHDCSSQEVHLDRREQEKISGLPKPEVGDEPEIADVGGEQVRRKFQLCRRGGVCRVKQPLRHR